MGATLIVGDLELALVLSGTHLPTSEGWKAELAWQREKVVSGGIRVRITQELDVVAFWSWNLDVVVF